jgi:hypothetical protein
MTAFRRQRCGSPALILSRTAGSTSAYRDRRRMTVPASRTTRCAPRGESGGPPSATETYERGEF